MVVLAVQVAGQQRLLAFASASAVVVAVELELPDFVPKQYVLGLEASLPVVALDQVEPSIVVLVVLVELASSDSVVDTQVVAMAVAVLDIVAVVQA